MNMRVTQRLLFPFLTSSLILVGCGEHNPDHGLNPNSNSYIGDECLESGRYYTNKDGKIVCCSEGDTAAECRTASSSSSSDSTSNSSMASSSQVKASSSSIQVIDPSSSSEEGNSSSESSSSEADLSSSSSVLVTNTCNDGLVEVQAINATIEDQTSACASQGDTISIIANDDTEDLCFESWESIATQEWLIYVSGYTSKELKVQIKDGEAWEAQKVTAKFISCGITYLGDTAMTDPVSGNTYKIADINGTQWMMEDLSNNGDTFLTLSEAEQYCPKGWRLPTGAEFQRDSASLELEYKGVDKGSIQYVNEFGIYWTNEDPTSYDVNGNNYCNGENCGVAFVYHANQEPYFQTNDSNEGLSVRCVRITTN